MSRDRSSSATRWWLLVVAALPALVMVIVVLAQGGALHAPPHVPSLARRPGTVRLSPAIARLSRVQAHAALQTVHNQLAASRSDRSSALAYGWAGAIVLLIGGLSLAAIALRSRAGALVGPPGTGEDLSPEPSVGAAAASGGARDRKLLVDACIDAFDISESTAVRTQLLDALRRAGVDPVEVPANARFDPTKHRAADTRATDRKAFDGLVVETERVGFVDRGRRVRWPEVVVYKFASRERI
jgi:molecular chaperone GrpE